jgi:hypothetical protein
MSVWHGQSNQLARPDQPLTLARMSTSDDGPKVGSLRAAFDPAAGGEAIARMIDEAYVERHEYRNATPEDWTGLDEKFYRRTTEQLAKAGFRELGNVVDETTERAMSFAHTVLRGFVNGEGTATAACYHVRFKGFFRLLQLLFILPRLRTIEFESELTDGTFVCTTNTLKLDTTLPVPGIEKRQLHKKSSVEELLAAHRVHLRDAIAARPGTSAKRIRTFAEAMEMQHRMQAIKSAFKKSAQYDIGAEITASAGGVPKTSEQRQMIASARAAHRQNVADREEGE